jgi:WD40 repeat protein
MAAPDQAMANLILGHKPGPPLWTLAFSPDGRWLARGGDSGVRLWDLRDPSAEPKTLKDQYGNTRKVAFSPDSGWLVAGATESYQVLLFHAPFDGPPLLLHVNQWVDNLAFSPDKRWLVVPSHYDGLVLDLNKADPTSEPIILRGHKDAIAEMAFSPDGMWFATGSRDKTVQLWNAADRFSGPNILRGHEGPISTLDFSRDSRWLATGSEDKTVRLWNVSSPFGEPISLHSRADPTKLRVWDLPATPQPTVSQILGDELGVGAGSVFSPDRKWLASLSNPADVVHLWNLTASPPTERDLQHSVWASPVFSSDGRWLATGGRDATIKLWDLTSPDPTVRPIVLRGHRGPIRSLAFSADGHHLVSGANDTLAFVWDLTAPNGSTNQRILAGGDRTSIVRTVAISPDGRYVLTGSWEPDNAARIWDLSLPDSASNPTKLSFKDRVFDSAFSADGHWAAAGSWDHTTQILDLTKPSAEPIILRGQTARTLSLAFSPDNRWLATGNEDRTVRLWDLSTDDPPANSVVLPALEGVGVSFSPNNRLLAFSQTEYRSNPFNPDGSLFASSDADTELYHVRLEDLIALACRIAGRNLTADEVMSSGQSPSPLDAKVCPQ